MAITGKELEYIKERVESPSRVNVHLKHIHNHIQRYSIDDPQFWVIGFDEDGNTVAFDGGHDTYEDAKKSIGMLDPLGNGDQKSYQIIKIFPDFFED